MISNIKSQKSNNPKAFYGHKPAHNITFLNVGPLPLFYDCPFNLQTSFETVFYPQNTAEFTRTKVRTTSKD